MVHDRVADEDDLVDRRSFDASLGGDGADSLLGSTVAIIDNLNGDGGNDSLQGLIGNDILVGGAGEDWAIYSGASGSVTVDLGVSRSSGADGNDNILGFEGVMGSVYADSIMGGIGNDTLNGGGGNDTLIGSSGMDHLIGGTGDDVILLGATDLASVLALFSAP
jgi:Ca2+-binding RTX toxin-like protein